MGKLQTDIEDLKNKFNDKCTENESLRQTLITQ
jgi:hypothetical protein